MGNQWAHLEPFSDADTSRALDTVGRLLTAAGQGAEASEVGRLLGDHDLLAPAKEKVGAREYDSAEHRGSDFARPAAGHREIGARGPHSGEAGTTGAVVEFRDHDRDYLDWVAGHARGYVINIGRIGRGNAVLHRAGCGTITSRAPFTGPYMKVCSESLGLLDEWALRQNGVAGQRCGLCRPPLGAPSAAGGRMIEGTENWRLILEAGRALTAAGHAPFSRIAVYQWIWSRYSRDDHDPPSLDPTFQGMIRNAPGGPQSAGGTPLLRVDRGLYVLADAAGVM